MLVEIASDVLRDKKIVFHKGLNCVLGSGKTENSIGKSMALMVVDFAFGGDDYITKCSDTYKFMGHHSFAFVHEFDGVEYRFERNTDSPGFVRRLEEDGDGILLSISDYRNWLLGKYGLGGLGGTFRGLIDPFVRVWHIPNFDKPIKVHKAADAVPMLLMLFGRYSSLRAMRDKNEDMKKQMSVRVKAIEMSLLPKTSADEYKAAGEIIETCEKEIASLAKESADVSASASALLTPALLELQVQRSRLMTRRSMYEKELERIEKYRQPKVSLTTRQLKRLKEFFPGVAIRRIEEIDAFHLAVSGYLQEQFSAAKDDYRQNIEDLTKKIVALDEKLRSEVQFDEHRQGVLVDRIVELTVRKVDAERVRNAYLQHKKAADDSRSAAKQLKEVLERALAEVAGLINCRIVELCQSIYEERRTPPMLQTSTKTCKYLVFNDTGAGKSYLSTLLLDMAFYSLTPIPFLVHDSILFNSIETSFVERFLPFYLDENRQVFISVDELVRFSADAQALLNEKSVLRLSKNHMLFIRDWKNEMQ